MLYQAPACTHIKAFSFYERGELALLAKWRTDSRDLGYGAGGALSPGQTT